LLVAAHTASLPEDTTLPIGAQVTQH
jgi:hypothetical protein